QAAAASPQLRDKLRQQNRWIDQPRSVFAPDRVQFRARNRRNDRNLAAASGTAQTSHFRRIRHANQGPRSIAADAMRSLFVVGFLLVFSTWGGQAVRAQPAAGAAPHIEWEVKSRFRLFRNEADFQRHVAAMRSGGVLAAESRLASET